MTILRDDVKQELVERINEINGTSLYVDALEFGEATPSTGAHNTQFPVEVIGGYGYKGQQTFYYNRVELSDLQNIVVTRIKAKPITSTHDALDEINRVCKLSLTKDDVVDEVLNLSGLPGETFTLTATEGSNRCTGALTFTLSGTADYLIQGTIQCYSNETQRALLVADTESGLNHLRITLYIGGVLHPVGADGLFRPILPFGKYDFTIQTPLPRGFGQNARILTVTKMADYSGVGDFSECFRDNRNILSVGDDVFAGNVSKLDLTRLFRNCTSLRSVGRNFLANPGGFSSLSQVFQYCSYLATIGETDFYDLHDGLTAIDSSLYACYRLQVVPKNWTLMSYQVESVNSTFGGCGRDVPTGCVLPEGLFKGFTRLKTIASVFSGTKATSWESGMFTQCTALENVSNCFSNSNFTKLEPHMFGTGSGPLDAGSCFANIKEIISVPAELMGNRDDINGYRLFGGSTIGYLDPDVLKSGTYSRLDHMFNGTDTSSFDFPNIFSEQTEISDITYLFANAKVRFTESNRDLFIAFSKVRSSYYCFSGTQFYGGVFPDGLFRNMRSIYNYQNMFAYCVGVDTPLVIPSGLFDNQGFNQYSNMFANAKSIRFAGTVFPKGNYARYINHMFGTTPSDIGYTAEFSRYTTWVRDATRLFAFPNMSMETYPDGLLDPFTTCSDMTSMFEGSTYAYIPGDAFNKCKSLSIATGLFSNTTNLTLGEGIFDQCISLTRADNMFIDATDLTVPDRLFTYCGKLTVLDSMFENVRFKSMPNALMGDSKASPTMNRMFAKSQWVKATTEVDSIGVSLSGTLKEFMYQSAMRSYADMYTVPELITYLGLTVDNHLNGNPADWAQFMTQSQIPSGSKQEMYLGLWQVEAIKDLPPGAPADTCRDTPLK